MKTHKLLMLGLVLFCFVLMTGCSSSPSPSDAEKALSQQIDSESGGQIKLVNFKKTDGQKFEVNAIQGYKMDYEAEIEFEADGLWLGKDIMNHSHDGLTFSFHPGQSSGNSLDQLNNSIAGGVAEHRGYHVKFSGVMNGEKKESGWKFEAGDSHLTSNVSSAAMPPSLNNNASDKSTQNASATPSGNSNFPPEAEQQYRKDSEFMSNVMKIVSFRATSGLTFFKTNPFDSSIIESYKLNFEAEFEMQTNGNMGGVDMHKGDRVKSANITIGSKTESGWKFGRPVESRFISASSPSLFSQLKAAQDVSQANACINTLRQIDAAANQWALEKHKNYGDPINFPDDLTPYIRLNADGKIPPCPDGGVYTLNRVGDTPTCSIPGHTLQGATKTATKVEEVPKVNPVNVTSLSPLKLQGIIIHGTSAIINNRVFNVGDSGDVITKDGKLNIHVVKITSTSATIEANDQIIELKP